VTAPAPKPAQFRVRCCDDGGRRILIAGEVLVCKHCDESDKMPFSGGAVEVDEKLKHWPPRA
jgi:hypothetical protein